MDSEKIWKAFLASKEFKQGLAFLVFAVSVGFGWTFGNSIFVDSACL